jgi:hypothetical protein
MDEYEAGYFAFYSLRPRSANPYGPGIAADRWECGWLDANDIHKEALADCHASPHVGCNHDHEYWSELS